MSKPEKMREITAGFWKAMNMAEPSVMQSDDDRTFYIIGPDTIEELEHRVSTGRLERRDRVKNHGNTAAFGYAEPRSLYATQIVIHTSDGTRGGVPTKAEVDVDSIGWQDDLVSLIGHGAVVLFHHLLKRKTNPFTVAEHRPDLAGTKGNA